MKLVERVGGFLTEAGVPFALIGASAMSAHGVVRASIDQDLLTTDLSCLLRAFWTTFQQAGAEIEIRKGDATDPLAGVIRFSAPSEQPIDVVVGKHSWQLQILKRAVAKPGSPFPVVRAADLILLKLFAGGPQDAWDIEQLLAGKDRQDLIQEVEREIALLPKDARTLWRKILGPS